MSMVSLCNDYYRDVVASINDDLMVRHISDTEHDYIIWATDTYKDAIYKTAADTMDPASVKELIDTGMLQYRFEKSKDLQQARTKEKAEVFTPSWLCNKMNNLCDEEYFGRKNIFNIEDDVNHKWQITQNKIEFENKDAWKDYVKSTKLEITCGEAPFLVSRYDTVTGEEIPVENRIGILDRKIRVINENVRQTKGGKRNSTWQDWVVCAFKSTYGYEYQGDSLFVARLNLVLSYLDYYKAFYGKELSVKNRHDKLWLQQIVDIVTWNLWQMDGLEKHVPIIGDACMIKEWGQSENGEIIDYAWG